MTATFSDWLNQEVVPKLRTATEVLSHLGATEVDPHLMGPAVAVGIQPFLYWSRDRASPPTSEANPGASTVVPSGRGASSLSNRLTPEVEAKLTAQGVKWDNEHACYRPLSYLGDAVWHAVNQLVKPSFRWSKDRSAWIPAA